MKFKATILVLFTSSILFSQTADFTTLLSELSSLTQTVNDSKSTFSQTITSENPGVLKYSQTETTKKGKTIETVYTFNLGDIDVNTIKPITSKDLIKVQLIVSKNQKMIKESVDEKKINYVNKVFILAKNIDNARELTNYFKKMVPICNEITNKRLSLSGYKNHLEWLQKNIVNANDFSQSFSANNIAPGSVSLVVIEAQKKSSKTTKYQFNLSDINANTLYFKSKGSNFVLQVSTNRKLKTIKKIEDGEQKNYVDDFEIICSSVENARDMLKVLKDIVPLAKKEFTNSFPKVSNVADGLTIINNKIKTIISDKVTYHQSFTENRITTFSNIEESSKKRETFNYTFNFLDINKQGVDIDIKGTKVFVVLKTVAKNKFIKYIKENTPQNYTNDISFVCNSVEDALIAQQVLKDIISICQKDQKEILTTTTKEEDVKNLINSVKSVQLAKYNYEQKITKLPNDKNALRFTSIKVSSKKSDENVQEFNLPDINSKSIEMDVSGKKVMVNFATKYQQKIIKTYKNGQIKSYTNKVSILCADIENARAIKSILTHLTKE